MAYVKNIWVDQEVERPKTYEVTNNQDGSITLTDSFGIVTELGTPVNATNMNHIEDGIDDHETRITVLEGGSNSANQDLSNLSIDGNAKLQYAPFAVNAGTMEGGKNATLSYSGSDLTCSACTITTTDGRTKAFNTSVTLDVSTQADGTYSVFKNYTDGSLSLIDEFKISKTVPASSINIANSTNAISSTVNTGSLANAFDGNKTSSSYVAFYNGGSSVSGVCYIGQDNLTQKIKKIVFVQGGYNQYNTCVSSAKIQISSDGTTWTDVQTVTLTTATGSTATTEITVDDYIMPSNPYQMRILANSGVIGSNDYSWFVNEVEFYAESKNYLNISTVPANLYVNNTMNNDLVLLGTCTIASGVITDVTNVPINNRWQQALVQGHSVVETYQNGQSWYRVYDDGWCEQGGYTAVPAAQYASAYFLKPYKDTNYTVTLSVYTPTSQYSYSSSVPVYVLATDYVQFRNNNATIEHDVRWFTAGYIS